MNRRQADFAGASRDEAMQRARELVPALRERAARGEDARAMLPETETDLHGAGLFRIVQPKRWGGMELDFTALVDIPAELGRGCASTACSSRRPRNRRRRVGSTRPPPPSSAWRRATRSTRRPTCA